MQEVYFILVYRHLLDHSRISSIMNFKITARYTSMGRESITGLSGSPRLAQGVEGISRDGQPTYILPYADANGRVVFVGRLAVLASSLFSPPEGNEGTTRGKIRSRFSTGAKGIKILINGIEEGL